MKPNFPIFIWDILGNEKSYKLMITSGFLMANRSKHYLNFINEIDVSVFRKLYYIGVVLGLILRIFYALTGTGIYHPDEIFQSLEMGHYIVYGYGFVPPEFQLSNPDTPSYAKARSWIIPLFFAAIFWIAKVSHLPYWSVTLPLIRLTMACISFMLIPATKRLGDVISQDKKIGYTSGFLVAIWWKIAYITTRPLFNVFFLPIFIYAIATFYERRLSAASEDETIKEKLVYFIGFGIATYVRIDFLIILFSMAVVHQVFDFMEGKKEQFLEDLSVVLTPSLGGWIVGMSIDAFMYEGIQDFGIVPVQWFKFNVLEGNSDSFGVAPFGWYAYRLVIENGLGLISVLLLSFLFFMGNVYFRRRKIFDQFFPSHHLTKEFVRLMLSIFLGWLLYETPWRAGLLFWNSASHKEERFMMNIYVIYFVAISMFIFLFSEFLENVLSKLQKVPKGKIPNFHPQGIYNLTVFLFIFSITFSSFVHMYYTPVFQFGSDINAAISYVGQQDDLEGLIIVERWFLTGAYTYLHNDVPIYWVNSTYTLELKTALNQGTYNYIVLPRYRYFEMDDLFETLVEDGWFIIKIFEGKTEVWIKA